MDCCLGTWVSSCMEGRNLLFPGIVGEKITPYVAVHSLVCCWAITAILCALGQIVKSQPSPQGLSCRILAHAQLKRWCEYLIRWCLKLSVMEELTKNTAIISWVHGLLFWKNSICSSGRFLCVKSSCFFNNYII